MATASQLFIVRDGVYVAIGIKVGNLFCDERLTVGRKNMYAYRVTERFTEIRRLPIGIEICDDLRVPLTDEQRARLKRLFLEHGLLYFPGQDLSLSQQIDVVTSIDALLQGSEGSGHISTDGTKGTLGRGELIFHSDLDFCEAPHKALSLLAIDVEALATSTRFVSNRRATAELPEALAAKLESLRLRIALPVDYMANFANMTAEAPQIVRSPLVSHPLTGESILMVSQQAVRFEGLAPEDSRELLDRVHDHVYAPENGYEHFWRNGDLLIWDNWALQHARGAITSDLPRTLQRVVIGTVSFRDLVRRAVQGVDCQDMESAIAIR